MTDERLPDLLDPATALPENEPDPAEVAAAQPYEGTDEEGAPFDKDPRTGEGPDPETDQLRAITEFTTLLRLGQAALNWAEGEHLHRSRSWYRDCLLFVHDCFNAPSYYGRAEWAYYGTQYRHTSWPPPAAVPVWWTNGTFGHVALSAGGGYCWSTDFLRTGYVDKVRIASITSGWGQVYRGWSEDINRTRVYHSDWWTLDVSSTIHAARNKLGIAHGSKLKHAIAAEVGVGNMDLRTNALGTGFREQYQRLQAKYLRATGQTVTKASADGIPGLGSLTWLGERHGFYVH